MTTRPEAPAELRLPCAIEPDEANALMQLAVGRLFGMMSRPFEPGDHEQFDKIESIVHACAESLGITAGSDHRPSYARDRLRGAAGD